MIYNEILVKPKQMELEQLKMQKQCEVEELLENKLTAKRVYKEKQMRNQVLVLSDEAVNSSNMLNLTSHQRRKDIEAAFSKIAPD